MIRSAHKQCVDALYDAGFRLYQNGPMHNPETGVTIWPGNTYQVTGTDIKGDKIVLRGTETLESVTHMAIRLSFLILTNRKVQNVLSNCKLFIRLRN